MPSVQKLDTHHKALTLNLDSSTFGSFARNRRGAGSRRLVLSRRSGVRHCRQNDFHLPQGSQRRSLRFRIALRIQPTARGDVQQQAIGILGVNLIYAAFYEVQIQESFLEGLAQDAVAERIEIDYVDLSNPLTAPASLRGPDGRFDTRPTATILPGLGGVGEYESSGSSSYHALQTSFQRRYSKGLTVSANYTYSHSIDDATTLSL